MSSGRTTHIHLLLQKVTDPAYLPHLFVVMMLKVEIIGSCHLISSVVIIIWVWEKKQNNFHVFISHLEIERFLTVMQAWNVEIWLPCSYAGFQKQNWKGRTSLKYSLLQQKPTGIDLNKSKEAAGICSLGSYTAELQQKRKRASTGHRGVQRTWADDESDAR